MRRRAKSTGTTRRFFFQGNASLIEPLIDCAVRGAAGKLAVDLYCGVGLFTLPLARKFERVVGVEGSEKAVGFAAKNVEQARLENVELCAAAVGEWLAETSEKTNAPDFILLDPPRAGTEKALIETLLQIRPAEISYVSCEPSTLARDLKILTGEGAYTIESITALDLFPQTHHVETVVRLNVKNKSLKRLNKTH